MKAMTDPEFDALCQLGLWLAYKAKKNKNAFWPLHVKAQSAIRFQSAMAPRQFTYFNKYLNPFIATHPKRSGPAEVEASYPNDYPKLLKELLGFDLPEGE